MFHTEDAKPDADGTWPRDINPLLLFESEHIEETHEPAPLLFQSEDTEKTHQPASFDDLPLTHDSAPMLDLPLTPIVVGRWRDAATRFALAVGVVCAVGLSFGLGFWLYEPQPSARSSSSDTADIEAGVGEGTGDTNRPLSAGGAISPARGIGGATSTATRRAPASSLPAAAAPLPPPPSPSPNLPKRVPLPDFAPRDGPLSGVWTLATQVESSNLSRFKGLTLGYRIELHQNGNGITGTGYKVTENGRVIAQRAQTAIALKGSVDGDRLTLTFTERGTRRPSSGKFILLRETDDVLRGRFSIPQHNPRALSKGAAPSRLISEKNASLPSLSIARP